MTAGVWIALPKVSVRVASLQSHQVGTDGAHICQPQMIRKQGEVVIGFLEQLSRIEKDHRRGGVHLGHEVKKHRGLGPEGRGQGDTAWKFLFDHGRKQIEPVETTIGACQLRCSFLA